MVPKELEEEIFTYIYETADMHRPHGGLIFSHGLERTTDFILPKDVEEENASWAPTPEQRQMLYTYWPLLAFVSICMMQLGKKITK